MTRTSYAIALGSNRRHRRYGAPGKVVRAACDHLGGLGTVTACSTIMQTAALGPAGRSFANAVCLILTDLPPPILLQELKAIERDFGRRGGRRWGPRVLDLDIILWSGGAWSDHRLTIPHQEFGSRSFVLRPLMEVAPRWRDPISGRTVRQLLHSVDRRSPLP